MRRLRQRRAFNAHTESVRPVNQSESRDARLRLRPRRYSGGGCGTLATNGLRNDRNWTPQRPQSAAKAIDPTPGERRGRVDRRRAPWERGAARRFIVNGRIGRSWDRYSDETHATTDMFNAQQRRNHFPEQRNLQETNGFPWGLAGSAVRRFVAAEDDLAPVLNR
jgi:hypothetical protein